MSTYVKELLSKELAEKFADVKDFVVVDTKGMSGNENNEMRGALREKGIRLTVVRNAMMTRAMESLGRGQASQLFQTGPCTVAYGGDSVVDVAKEMVDWTKKVKTLSLKGAFVDGMVLDVAGAEALAKMPNRAELQGTIVMLAASPGRRVAGCILSPGGIIAGCIKGLIEKLEKSAA
ncbi:MAG TPA: 50S ribosomal protein L10 [Anaerohalosphaeraceae bacterium]|jgi:large subunit ribosomal protein L10|nr:50S ribosomal protein L10 [Anaerohalosphaeraceae bacterium]HRT49248.1 50S ribosomal protein L10 [Anaerohalosphaeraceae bacterium]HRT85213.1 50S ribosomal protein L10 [Anaerohalosphaeraceae bacterium]